MRIRCPQPTLSHCVPPNRHRRAGRHATDAFPKRTADHRERPGGGDAAMERSRATPTRTSDNTDFDQTAWPDPGSTIVSMKAGAR